MTNNIPVVGEFYRHFKNKLYQILAIATHSETGEELVIYQALYDDYKVYARPLSMFISEVDHGKYPDVSQRYRFEKIEQSDLTKVRDEFAVLKKTDDAKEAARKATVANENKAKGEEVNEKDGDNPDPMLMEFLDFRTMEEKVKYLAENKKKLTDDLINAMAASIDVTVADGPMELRYSSLRSCLQTKAKYEITRLRNFV